jgi:hypothetical protein
MLAIALHLLHDKLFLASLGEAHNSTAPGHPV